MCLIKKEWITNLIRMHLSGFKYEKDICYEKDKFSARSTELYNINILPHGIASRSKSAKNS